MIDAIAQTLVDFVWQGAVLALVFFLIERTMGFADPRQRYGLWCAAMLAMVSAPLATFSHYCWDVRNLASGTAAKSSFWNAMTTATPPIEGERNWLVIAWAVGVVALSCRLLASWCAARRYARRDTQPAASQWQERAGQIAARMGITQAFRLLESPHASTPGVIGWWRPIVILPASALIQLPVEQLEAVLAHELAHILRRDYLVNLLQCIAETVLFYHPAVWWVSHRIRQEREYCCDDLAITACGDRRRYAQSLLAIEELRSGSVSLQMAIAGNSLLQRIERIARSPRRHRPSRGVQ